MMLPRRLEDEGPFYKVYPEGHIEHWDGHRIPDPHYLSDNDVDLNRNFPHSWAPEPEQTGAGQFPGSEPESRAVIDWATAHTNIYAWLNLHTFGGLFIRPLGHAPDSKMDPMDLAIYKQVEAWGQAYTGYPMVSGFHEFLYEPDKPLHGRSVGLRVPAARRARVRHRALGSVRAPRASSGRSRSSITTRTSRATSCCASPRGTRSTTRGACSGRGRRRRIRSSVRWRLAGSTGAWGCGTRRSR